MKLILFIILLIVSSSAKATAEQDDTPNAFFTGLIKLSAHLTIPLAEIIASDSAANELRLFRTGKHDGLPIVFNADSEASKELLNGDYYQELTAYLIAAMARWYGGSIPANDGLYLHSDTFRVFSPADAVGEFTDGVDVADVVGTITYYVRMTSEQGKLNFMATNVMSLGSYAGQNYLQYDLVKNPGSGSFKSRVQVFQWQQAIPERYRVN